MLLFELMNKALPTELVNRNDDEIVFKFDVPDGRVYHIEYDKMHHHPPVWEVSFRDIGDSSLDRYELTNKGSEIPILVTSFVNVGDFVKSNPEATVFFTADNDKRASVYNKMIKRVVPYVLTDKSPEGKTEFYVGGNPDHVQAYKQKMDQLNTPG